jgi:hypothetical protein
MKSACLIFSLLLLPSQVLRPRTSISPQSPSIEPKTAFEWFARARDQMNIRLPGSAPFHMKVTFHAFPGIEYTRKGESPEIITGDGAYEETWVAPHQWRREVTLADYHAVEVESDHGRRFRASTDYEPGRMLMLMNALLEPVPRNLASSDYKQDRAARGWKVDHAANADASLVRIGRGDWTYGSARFSDSFYFSPHGLLLLRDQDGLKTAWSNAMAFGGKIVPTRITVTAGERTLLSADLTVTPAGQASPFEFEFEGAPAEPGMTLRLLQSFEVSGASPLSRDPEWPGANHSALSISGVVDRSGRYREVELIVTMNLGADADIVHLMTDLRKSRWHPATIDGSPCESPWWVLYVKDVNQAGPSGHGPS